MALFFKNSLASLFEEVILLSTSKSIRFFSSYSKVGTPLNTVSISSSVREETLPVNKHSDTSLACRYSSFPCKSVMICLASSC